MRSNRGLGAIFVWAGIIAAANPNERQKVETWQLGLGEQRTITIHPEEEIEASRRGLATIEQQSEQSWQVTAVKVGFLLINVKSKAETLRTIKVHISDTSKVNRSKLPQLCLDGAVECDEHGLWLRGTTTSFTPWKEALLWCRAHRHCQFSVSLDGKGKESLIRELRGILKADDEVKMESPLRITVIRYCLDDADKTIVSSGNGHWLKQMEIAVTCHSSRNALYLLTASVALLSQDMAKQLGVKGSWQEMSKLITERLSSRIMDKLTEQSTAILAQPRFLLRSGRTARISSGGEFKVMFAETHAEQQQREGWKTYGIDITLSLNEAGLEHLQIETELKLSNPSESSFSSLQSHRIASDLLVRRGERTLVGTTELYSKATEQQGSLLIQRIPIIGPIFKITQEATGSRLLMYWLEVRAASEGNARPSLAEPEITKEQLKAG